MIAFLLDNSITSQKKLRIDSLIYHLNSKGIICHLYGNAGHNTLEYNSFKPAKYSKIINFNDYRISKIDLFKYGFLFYSYGRKKHLIRVIKRIFHLVINVHNILFKNIQVINYTDINKTHDLSQIFPLDKYVENHNFISVIEDIDINFKIDEYLKYEKTIYLNAAIASPHHFKNTIIPKLDSKIKVSGCYYSTINNKPLDISNSSLFENWIASLK
ncbi:hypothetical protein [Halobacteriovorax sp. DPLXC-1]|uniref:hypothetical protein n=1 Tax=Halobacteriovorax sp. DPLXC-1 TaxID=3110771 RepID=UPI002FF2C2C4